MCVTRHCCCHKGKDIHICIGRGHSCPHHLVLIIVYPQALMFFGEVSLSLLSIHIFWGGIIIYHCHWLPPTSWSSLPYIIIVVIHSHLACGGLVIIISWGQHQSSVIQVLHIYHCHSLSIIMCERRARGPCLRLLEINIVMSSLLFMLLTYYGVMTNKCD